MNRIFASIIMLLCSPFILIICFLIYIEDGGPVLFKQKRFRESSRFFIIYKFRSMKKSTPNVATHLLGDPEKYLLRTGKFIRKLSLDELPNLINIIKGEMNFVGPRPALYNQEDLIQMRISYGLDKLKPGLTGWAQINGRDENSLDEKIKLELNYLENRSLLLDIKIILLTFYTVFSSKGIKH